MVSSSVQTYHVGASPDRLCAGTFSIGSPHRFDFVAYFETGNDRDRWYHSINGFQDSVMSLSQQLLSTLGTDLDTPNFRNQIRTAVQALGVRLQAYRVYWMMRYALLGVENNNYIPLSIVIGFSLMEDLLGITENRAFRTSNGQYQ
jgi:hypothetical protein